MAADDPRKASDVDAAAPVKAAEVKSSGDAAATPAGADAGKTGPPPVSYLQLFRFADGLDVAMLLAAYGSAMLGGAIAPISAIILGELFNGVSNPAAFDDTVNRMSGYLGLVALGCFLMNLAGIGLASLSAERQARRARVAYLRAILAQDQAWYDRARPGEAASRLSSDTLNFQAGLGDKPCLMLSGLGQFICGFIIAFSVSPDSWKLALVLLAFVPAVAAVFGLLFSLIKELEGGTDDAYARAGDVATEALTLIRTVAAYGGERAELTRYDKHLQEAEKAGYRKGLVGGASGGIFWMVLMLFYGVGLYVGALFIIANRKAHPECVLFPIGDACFGGGEVIQCLFALIQGAASMGFVFPNAKYVAGAQAAAARLYETMDRIPPIDAFGDRGGYVPPEGAFKGRIEFRDVTFTYPTRPDVKVLHHFNLTIEPGTTVALVGASGSGKSTLVGLILRWYDPQEGSVLVDGVDVKEYDVPWLRSRMGLVSQEPQLLPGTIAENIALGLPQRAEGGAGTGKGTTGKQGKHAKGSSGAQEEPVSVLAGDVDMVAVEGAAKAANAHDFITSLPSGYETPVTGAQLSGGQKQRVAIARAIIRNPAVLLLDEATSALDTQSERIVQASIDALLLAKDGSGRGARTSVVIAHRLSTVVNADRIVVLEAGAVLEEGTHEQLLAKGKEGGTYARLWDLQRLGSGQVASPTAAVETLGSTPKVAAAVEATEVVAAEDTPMAAPAAPSSAVAAAGDSTTLVIENPMHAASGQGKGAKGASVAPEGSPAKPERKRTDWARLWSYLRSDAGWVALGVVLAAANGCLLPGFSLVLANVFDVFYLPDNDEVQRQALVYLWIFLGIGAGAFGINVLQGYAYGIFGERLTRRLRYEAFGAAVRQEIGWYDMPEQAVGALTARLGTDASQLRLVLGARMGDKVASLATGIMGIVIAFTASWKLALIVTAITPLFIAATAVENQVTFNSVETAKEAYAKAGAVATDATAAIRVVNSYSLQPLFLRRFVSMLAAPYQAGKKRALAAGLGVGVSQGFQPGIPALCFWVGAQLIKQGDISFGDVLKVYFAFTFSTIGLQNVGSLAQDVAQLASAFAGLTALIDRTSACDATREGPAAGYVPPEGAAPSGAIEFRDVRFKYPARPDQTVLRGLNLKVEPGQTVAIVGPSGSGKSTLIQLLQRFYDPDAGAVLLDGRDVREYDPAWLRSHIGWVQQEAPLWADSLAYNIAYGKTGPKPLPEQGMPREAKEGAVVPPTFTMPDGVEQAAADANAASFIKGFPWGFATFTGIGGLQLSGGQKQRVAIARAIIRAPRILLLDEATSALDSESERVVQESIDRLLQEGRADGGSGRTTLVIAHRLATVRGSDVIVVVDKGVVVESGSHAQLMARPDGLYRKLALAQDPAAA